MAHHLNASRFSLSASSVLQCALFKPLGAAMFALCALCSIVSATQSHAADLPVLKVGDQSLQTRGILEASGQLKDLPYKIEWFNFPAAQPLGEALNAGAVDVGGLGDAPLVFALAAGARVRAVAATRSNPLDLAIVVGAHSPLNDAASLKGKRIATTRGSIGHYLALAALKKANVPLTDVSFVFLAPADAKAAMHGRCGTRTPRLAKRAITIASSPTASVFPKDSAIRLRPNARLRTSARNSPTSCDAWRPVSVGRFRIPTKWRRCNRKSRACRPMC
jgi:hypothetical protein